MGFGEGEAELEDAEEKDLADRLGGLDIGKCEGERARSPIS